MPKMEFTSFTEATDFLFESVPKNSAIKGLGIAGLERSKHFLAELSNPQDSRPALHIAATSGKGTTLYMIDAILRAHGFRTVMLTSPHVYSITERVIVDGAPISEEDFVRHFNSLLPTYYKLLEHTQAPSYFEVNMAIGFLAAQDVGADYMLVETGLGGLLDTSNTIGRPDKVPIIGRIGYDHVEILGTTLAEIAAQKCGIIGDRQTVIALSQTPDVNAVISKTVAACKAQLHWADTHAAAREYSDLRTINSQLSGEHQYDNLALALSTLQHIASRDQWVLDRSLIATALSNIQMPGRFEIVRQGDMTVVFDGAHNPQKLSATLRAMQQQFGAQPYGIVFASGQRKQTSEMLELLSTASQEIVSRVFR